MLVCLILLLAGCTTKEYIKSAPPVVLLEGGNFECVPKTNLELLMCYENAKDRVKLYEWDKKELRKFYGLENDKSPI